MLNRKSIERALARAAGHQDESVVARLALFAPALLKAADLRAQLAAEAPEWTDEEIEAARLGKETLLSLRPVTIDSERFLQTVDAIAAALLDNDEIEGDMLEACRAIDWRRFASAELLESAGRDPMGYLHAVEVHAGEDDLLDIFLLPVLGLALRVFLDEAADEGSRRIARTGTDTTSASLPRLRLRRRRRERDRHAAQRTRQAALVHVLRRTLGLRAHPLRRLRRSGRVGPLLHP